MFEKLERDKNKTIGKLEETAENKDTKRSKLKNSNFKMNETTRGKETEKINNKLSNIKPNQSEIYLKWNQEPNNKNYFCTLYHAMI